MNSSKKIILGIFTVLPLVLTLFYIVLFFAFFFEVAVEKIHHEPGDLHNEMPHFLQSFFPMMVMIFVAIIIGIILMVYYLVHVSNNHKFDSTQKLLWVLIIIFTNTIGQIAYFILEVWPERPAKENT